MSPLSPVVFVEPDHWETMRPSAWRGICFFSIKGPARADLCSAKLFRPSQKLSGRPCFAQHCSWLHLGALVLTAGGLVVRSPCLPWNITWPRPQCNCTSGSVSRAIVRGSVREPGLPAVISAQWGEPVENRLVEPKSNVGFRPVFPVGSCNRTEPRPRLPWQAWLPGTVPD